MNSTILVFIFTSQAYALTRHEIKLQSPVTTAAAKLPKRRENQKSNQIPTNYQRSFNKTALVSVKNCFISCPRFSLESPFQEGSRFYPRPVRKPVVTITRKPALRPGVITKPKIVERPKKPLPPPPQPKPGPDGCYELDAVTSRALEDELQKIMIKVWQALPDDAPNDEEKMVVEKIKNEASDDVRNALGLNVTQRLLSTFNPLNVKVHFSTKPERKYLRHFLKKYNFVAFKRIVRVNNTFAAQVKTIADYDQLCSMKNIFCGAAKITVSPCYRFIQCPKNLKTIYGIPEEDIPAENKDSIDQAPKENNDVPKECIKVKEETKDKSAIEKAKEPDVKKVEEIKPIVIESNIKTKPNTGKAAEAVKTAPKPADAKPNVQKTSVASAKSASPVKPVENKPQNIPATKTLSNTQTKNTTVTKKPEITKATVTEDNKTTASNTTAKTITNVATDDKTKLNIVAPNTKTVASTQKPTDSKVPSTSAVKPVTKPIESKVTNTTGAKAIVTKPTESKVSNEAATTAQVVNTKTTTVETKTTNIATKTTNVITKTTNVNTKTTNVDTKTTNVNTTKPNVTTTKTEVKNDKPTVTYTKPVNVTVKPVNVTAKPVNVTAKPVNVTAKPVNVTAKPVNVTAKPVNVTAKPVNVTAKPAEVTKNITPIKTTKVTPIKAQQTKTVTNPTPTKVNAKNVSKQVKKPDAKKQADTKKPAKGDDFDELDDQELYQYLMSAGIVLDECSGSDVE